MNIRLLTKIVVALAFLTGCAMVIAVDTEFYTGVSYSPSSADAGESAIGDSKLGAMSAACRAWHGSDHDARETQSGQCYVTQDGNRYRCYNSSNPPVGGLCANWGFSDCVLSQTSPGCDFVDKTNNGCSSRQQIGNPCNAATGNKYFHERVLSSGGLELVLSYNSYHYANVHPIGFKWTSNWHRRVKIISNQMTYIGSDGRGETWELLDSEWVADSDSTKSVELIQEDNDFVVLVSNVNGSSEKFNSNGNLIQESWPDGSFIVYSIERGRPISVQDQYGTQFTISYWDASSGGARGKLRYVIDQLGNYTTFEYDVNQNLISIVFPDQTPQNGIDNPRKTYHYENPNYPNHLTGITDENGVRYATYAYDAEGKAISTEHSQTTNPVGQKKFELDYQTEATQ